MSGPGSVAQARQSELTSRISESCSESVRGAVRKLSLISGAPRTMAIAPLMVPSSMIAEWSRDFRMLHALVSRLSSVDSAFAVENAARYGLSADLARAYCHAPAGEGPAFFRPDCILSRDGLKVLELNIDYGSCGISLGTELVRFYRSVPGYADSFESVAGTSIDRTFPGARVLGDYLRKAAGSDRRIILWDIAGRSGTLLGSRTTFVRSLADQGVALEIRAGEEILSSIGTGAFHFRYFGYPHFGNPATGTLAAYLGLTREEIASNDLSAATLVSDSKLNLARLWSHEWRSQMTGEERTLVEKYVPESLRLGPEFPETTKTARENKDHWVIKGSSSFQGRDVFVGRHCGSEEWDRLLSKYAAGGQGIIQRLVDPIGLEIPLTDGRSERTFGRSGESHLINLFFLGGEFGGAAARLRLGHDSSVVGAPDGSTVIGCPVGGYDDFGSE